MFYVYALFRRDGSPCYIGKGKGSRWSEYDRHPEKCHNPLLKAILLSEGPLPRVKLWMGPSEQEAFDMERLWIATIGRQNNGPLVNFTDGGEGTSGRPMSERAKLKISMANKGAKRSDLARQHIRESLPIRDGDKNPFFRKKHSDETREHWSRIRKGRSHTEEEKQKISASLIGHAGYWFGKKQSPEMIEKKAAANRGRKRTEETREKMRVAQRRSQERRRFASVLFAALDQTYDQGAVRWQA